MNIVRLVENFYGKAVCVLNFFTPLFDLAARYVVAYAFFSSGLVKIQSWSSTLYLFENEYAVPFLPPELAAYMGTAAELTLPVLLMLGLCSRFTAIALFVFNIVAVLSYPDISPAGVKDHVLWGALLLMTIFHGPGKLSIDYWIGIWLSKRAKQKSSY